MYFHMLYSCKVEQPDACQYIGVINFEENVHVEIKSFVNITWKLLPLKIGREPH